MPAGTTELTVSWRSNTAKEAPTSKLQAPTSNHGGHQVLGTSYFPLIILDSSSLQVYSNLSTSRQYLTLSI